MTSLLPIVASATAEVMDTVFDTSEDSVAAKKRKTCNFDCSSTTFSGPGQNEIFLCRVEESEVKKFEENRNRILESYPEDHKAMFNELGFGKYQGKQYPAMIVNPFSVVPGDVRKNWAAKYVKVSKPWSLVLHWRSDCLSSPVSTSLHDFLLFRIGWTDQWH